MDEIAKRKMVAAIANLPALPEVTSRLLQMVNDPDTSAGEVSRLISSDTAMASRVLRMANSAFYGIPRTITTVQNAVVLLGMKVVNSLVLTLSVAGLFPGERKSSAIDRKAFWKHSLATAVAAKLLAQKARRVSLFDAEECFSAGILHDIGRLVLNQYFTAELAAVMRSSRTSVLPLVEEERRALGYDHAEVGEWLTSKWELPQNIRAPIVHHHRPEGAVHGREITYLVHLADWLAHRAGLGLDPTEPCGSLAEGSLALLSLDEAALQSLLEILPVELEKLEVTFTPV